jgi:predicted porin
MKKLCVSTAMILGLAAATYATAASADDFMATKAPPAATAKASLPPATCSSLEDFVVTACPLTWNGLTLYGTIDGGVTWLSHGVPFNGTSAVGANYLIQKNSNRPQWSLAPNGLSNSDIGLKGKEPIAPGWDFIFDLQAGFDPYSLQFSNGVHSVAQNSGVPLTDQTAGADSSRGGQFYNSVGYLGVSSPYGTLTVFRQNSLTLEAVFAYDPMGASYAFSPIGWQGITCGVGDTETCRFTTSVKYHVDIGQFRVAALWQFGGYDLNNASTGAYQFQLGGDITNLAGGTLSLDAIGSFVQNAVSLAVAGNTLPAVLPQVLTATLSDDMSVMLVGKYSNGPFKLYAGYEYIQYAPPTTPYAPRTGFIDIGGDFVCAGCAAINNTNINSTAFNAGDKPFNVVWTGVKYAVTDQLDLTGAYYHYDQPAFGAPVNCTANAAASANCHGTFDAVSFVVDWQFAKKFDAYAGIMFSQVNGGLANGYLNRSMVDPTVGLRFRF